MVTPLNYYMVKWLKKIYQLICLINKLSSVHDKS